MEENNCKNTPQEELGSKKEKIKYKFQKKFSDRETEDYKTWLSFYPKKTYFKFQLDCWGYFDPRPQINSNITSVIVLIILFVTLLSMSISWFHLLLVPFLFFGWGDFYLNLPFNTGKTDECENPSYGFYMYHIDPVPGKLNIPTCFIWQWGDYNSWEMPWSYEWVRTSILLKDNTWEHETKGNYREFYKDEWKNKQQVYFFDFLDKSDNTVIPTKIYVEEREWRPKWLMWTNIFSKTRKTIDVHFSKEVGSRKGSWKGGTIGCSYLMKKNESAIQCIKRMEIEKTFR